MNNYAMQEYIKAFPYTVFTRQSRWNTNDKGVIKLAQCLEEDFYVLDLKGNLITESDLGCVGFSHWSAKLTEF